MMDFQTLRDELFFSEIGLLEGVDVALGNGVLIIKQHLIILNQNQALHFYTTFI